MQHQVYAFARSTDESVVLVVLHAGDEVLEELKIPLQSSPVLSPSSKAKLGDGTVLEEKLGEAEARIEAGHLVIKMPPRSIVVLAPGLAQ
jgi:hypothetical protein